MSSWKIKQLKSVSLSSPVLIEGLPGIGNVGKVAVDFLVEEIKAKKIYEISSYTMPHSVFINDKNIVELPKIELYHKKHKNNDFLFLCGDVQPSDEISCYEFSGEIISLCKKHRCRDIITLGGIGLIDIPKKPKIYITGNSGRAVSKYKDKEMKDSLYGIVGPIVGVTGLLLGMADKSTNAVALLSETYGHPMHLGIKGAKEILRYMNRRFKFGINVEKLDKEIKELEDEALKRAEELAKIQSQNKKPGHDVNYIG
ncbi:hypothetical protein GF323_00020 [Candidatus Woesearchaeota archaeon]|nr:hypothetical protein [Candidatus Woesearchaeota archaeon]